jgi:predicted AlkP superfamily phosphohydrolase/phosphomutase
MSRLPESATFPLPSPRIVSPKHSMPATPAARTVVIGLESAELRLVEKWAGEGSLPFLGSLLRGSPLVTLHTPLHALQTGLWPSLLTGVSPGRHARYVLWSQIRNGTYDMRGPLTVPSSLRRYQEFLADRGIDSVLADIPSDVRIPGHRGMQIVDWGTEFRFGDCETEPRDVAARIAREVGSYPIAPFRLSGDSQPEHLELARLLDEAVRRKGAFTRWLLALPDIRHVVSVFSEMHKAAHWFWKYMDDNHVDHEDTPPALREAVKRVYEGMDRELAALAALLGPEDNLVVFSEQGMQANYRGEHLAEPLLEALGLLERSSSRPPSLPDGVFDRRTGSRGPPAGERSGLWRALKATRSHIPEALKAPLRSLRRRADIDWRRTRVFRLPTDRNTYFRVNLRGREPLGCVEPGAEYEALLARLEIELRALRNGATGAAAVVDVFRLRDIFPGERADDLPDLAVEWAADAPIDSLQSDTVGTLSLPVRELRSGNHRSEGFLLARGPAFVSGPARITGDILQIPATLLAAHGVPQPAQFERGPLPILAA